MKNPKKDVTEREGGLEEKVSEIKYEEYKEQCIRRDELKKRS